MNNWEWLLLIPSVFGIAMFDYIIFKRWLKCERCGYTRSEWQTYLLPTMIEVLLFLAGVAIGVGVFGGAK
jgi:hypothetical protein